MIGETVLVVEGLTAAGALPRRLVHVRSGEIVALAGLVGAGRSEIARADLRRRPVRHRHASPSRGPAAQAHPAGGDGPRPRARPRGPAQAGPRARLDASRATRPSRSAAALAAGLITSRGRERRARSRDSRLEVKTAALDTEAGTLSGGNQQKVVLAKWLATEPARADRRRADARHRRRHARPRCTACSRELAGRGIAILMISSELPEVLGMADRVLVVREGRITADDRPRGCDRRVRHVRRHPPPSEELAS